jgi:hypothetical protein
LLFPDQILKIGHISQRQAGSQLVCVDVRV